MLSIDYHLDRSTPPINRSTPNHRECEPCAIDKKKKKIYNFFNLSRSNREKLNLKLCVREASYKQCVHADHCEIFLCDNHLIKKIQQIAEDIRIK